MKYSSLIFFPNEYPDLCWNSTLNSIGQKCINIYRYPDLNQRSLESKIILTFQGIFVNNFFLHYIKKFSWSKKLFFFFENSSLAADGLLHKKANVATLKTWLGSQGIVVKSKSKKEELVLMVLTKLGTYLLHWIKNQCF